MRGGSRRGVPARVAAARRGTREGRGASNVGAQGKRRGKWRRGWGGVHLEPQAVLSEVMEAGHELGEKASVLLKAGKVVPSSLWVELMVAAIGASGSGPFVLEGFPSDVPTLEAFEEALGSGVSVGARLWLSWCC